MKVPKILIVGRVGQVGWNCVTSSRVSARFRCVDYPEIDFSKPQMVREVVRSAQPSILINAAAYTAVDKAETDI